MAYKDYLYWLVLIGFALTLGVGGFLGWIIFVVENDYEVVVTVQAVEHSTKWGDHTNVWARVYGEQDITYIFTDFHTFGIGKTYRIKFRNHYYFPAGIRGEVSLIEKLQDE